MRLKLLLIFILLIPSITAFDRIKINETTFVFDNNISKQDKIDFVLNNNFHKGITQIWFLNKWNKWDGFYWQKFRAIAIYNFPDDYWREIIRHEYIHYIWFNTNYTFRKNYCDAHRTEINEFHKNQNIYYYNECCQEVYAYSY